MSKSNVIRVAPIGRYDTKDSFISSSTDWKSHTDAIDEPVKAGMKPSPLVIALRPLLISMTCFGIFDYWAMFDNGIIRPRRIVLKVYRVVTITILVGNCVRFFPAYTRNTEFGPELLTSVMIHAYFIHSALNSIACLTAVENPKKLRYFCTLWDKYWKKAMETWNSSTCENKTACKRLKRIIVVCTILGWAFIISNTLFSFYTMFYTETFHDVITPLTSHHPYAPVARVVFLVVHVFISAVWIYTGILTFLMHLLLYEAAKAFAKKMEQMKPKSLTDVEGEMELCRQQHNRLCELIDVVDGIFQFIVGISLFSYIFCTLIIVYNMCWYETVRSSAGQLVSHFFWLSGMVTMLVLLMAASCLVNNWVSD